MTNHTTPVSAAVAFRKWWDAAHPETAWQKAQWEKLFPDMFTGFQGGLSSPPPPQGEGKQQPVAFISARDLRHLAEKTRRSVTAWPEAAEEGDDLAVYTALASKGSGRDAKAAFEDRYSRSAEDPSSAEMLEIWLDAWNARGGDEGMVLVPREPTPAMCAAGFMVSEAEHDPAGVYRAMLASVDGRKQP